MTNIDNSTLKTWELRQEALESGTARARVFDWDGAAKILIETAAENASAGLREDWSWTSDYILLDGQVVSENDFGCFLASDWATPTLEINGEYIECWRYSSDVLFLWEAETFWPESAKAIFNDGRKKKEEKG